MTRRGCRRSESSGWGEKSNFWMMGETGPCGPCSEILYDQGEGTGCGKPACDVHCECDRHLEIWNLVFTQFDRDASGKLTPLPKPNIDTGMGLERLAAVVQGVTSNYESDLFTGIIRFIEKISGRTYGKNGEDDISIRVIADHSRSVAFLVGDGVLPSNEGRGYVLRRILRRAARHGKLLGMDRPFLNEVCGVVIDEMQGAYPDLADKAAFIRKVVESEEQRFIETLDAGLRILQEEVAVLKAAGEALQRYGMGSGTSRGRLGTTPPLLEVEAAAAEFFGMEQSFYLPSGYLSAGVVMRALAKNPNDRYPTAQTMARALRTAVERSVKANPPAETAA